MELKSITSERLLRCVLVLVSLFVMRTHSFPFRIQIMSYGTGNSNDVFQRQKESILSNNFYSRNRYTHACVNTFSPIKLYNQNNNNDNSNTDKNNIENIIDMTPQERILLQIGIQPETAEQKQTRIRQRQYQMQKVQQEKYINIAVAILSILAAVSNYAYQYTHPITSISLLTEMANKSDSVKVIGHNGKPTLVEFWAPWCENCKESAPTIYSIENEYSQKINFISINADLPSNFPIIERFRVDAIPHLAFVSSDGIVQTALIGPIPKSVLRADLDYLLNYHSNVDDADAAFVRKDDAEMELPYQMFDAFRADPSMRKIDFGM